jgi:hypothetical protein
VLENLYDKMKSRPYNVDLPTLWQQLGMEREGDQVILIDTAPLAKVREAITYGTAGASLKPAAVDSRNAAIFAGRTAAIFPPDRSHD